MIYYVYFVCVVILSAFVPLYHVHIVPTEARRRCQPPLEPESQMIVKHQMDAGNQTWILCKSIKCSYLVKCLSKSDCYMGQLVSGKGSHPDGPDLSGVSLRGTWSF